ncbi:aldo/keto reductase [Chitinophaga ginsengisoli]|uniref:Aryl-alcohol dehydrogenase-like predicted oxidoreductase n=1 Tax=Chitinophaga ginsengisoli TaxID=363837 RepID=A0A2P8G2N2_9BACT|nr:aldo/keto reductase [Chitinophaga ginsengisoli]PSL28233.1 aryl-alcohol dehydrogenase-like predicted oxidoreductase [Chitinophaga ginsengisoli]
MKYSKLGNTGLVVSRLSFGAMTFGNDPSITAVYKVTQEDAQTMVDKALDAGINFFDTADGYSAGQSEVMLGKALAKRRQDVVIATKVGFRTGEPVTQAGLSRRHILYSCEQSLKRLNTDYIDLYIVHKEDPYTPLEETLETLDMLVRAGKVRYIGFSNWTVWKAAIAYQMQKERGWATFCNGQMYYSLLGRDVEYDIVPFMQHAGIGMTIWSPLAGGFLSGKYTREGAKDQDNRLSGFDILPFDKEKGYDVVDVLKEIAATHNASPAQVALSWLLSKPVVSSILVGASKLHQLENNLKAVEMELNDTEIKTLDDLTQPGISYPHWFVQNLADPKHKEILGTK